MHSELLDLLALRAENDPRLAQILQEMRQQGGTPMVIMHDVNTGKVTSSEDGGPFQPAHAAIRSMVTGAPYRDPGLVDPVTADDDDLRAMLHYLIDYYRDDLLEDPNFDEAIEATIRAIHSPSSQATLARIPDNYQRWDRIVDALLDSFDEE